MADRPCFLDPSEFPFLEALRDEAEGIAAECAAVGQTLLHPWPERNLYESVDPETQQTEQGVGWTVFGLYAFGKKKQEHCDLCPLTTRLVEAMPYAPTTAAFSVLRPQTHILPHSGYLGYSSTVLRCHLGLDIPTPSFPVVAPRRAGTWFKQSVWQFDQENALSYTGTAIRVGNRAATWKTGELMVFDDSITHEAWNFTAKPRIVLLIDFERPERYRLPSHLLAQLDATSSTQPFEDGFRGHEYLDSLTSKHGY